MTTITFTGDITFDGYFSEAYKNENLLDESVSQFLKSSDHVVANIVGPITAYTKADESARMPHKQDPECMDFLKDAMNVDILSLANENMKDYGHVGLKDTLEHAKRAGFTAIGAGDSMFEYWPSCIVGDDVKVGIISVAQIWKNVKLSDKYCGVFTWGKNGVVKKNLIKREIADLKEKGADYVIVVAHCGIDYMNIPAPYIRSKFEKLIAYGADCVVASHPHVANNYEMIQGKPVFYSIGNFMFDNDEQRAHAHTDEGLLMKITADKSGLTWEPMGIKIDRDQQRIVKGDLPAIFSEVTEKEWKELWPLQAKISLEQDMEIQSEENEELNGKAALIRHELNVADKSSITRELVSGAKKSLLQTWRFASRKDIKDYILGK